MTLEAPAPSHAAAPSQHLAMHHHHDTGHPSPPSKRDLKSWWKGFKLQPKQSEAHDTEVRSTGIFRVPLRQSITYANVAISLVDENGESYIYGYVPIVVAKCGVFLKEKATSIEGIFRLSGSEKRIKELKTIFDSPDRYGKGLVWDGYTVHDAANVLRRYLNDLPEPVVPLDLYEKFRDPLRGATRQAVGDTEGPHFVENFDEKQAIGRYQKLITELPPLNRQLLLYILDLLAVFAAKADENRMNSQNLAAIFQPGMLSHPSHAMAPEEYRLNQCVLIFLIENQDNFLIGMYGTAADEKTKKEVELGQHHQPSGLAALTTTTTPTRAGDDQSGLGRSASNASAGAESVRRDGKIRRNRSTSSRHSRQSRNEPGRPGSTTPSSPAALATTPTSGGGLTRSNTVPSKKSPRLSAGGRFQKDLFFGPAAAAAATPAAVVPATAQPHMPGEFPVTPDEAAHMVVASPPTETSPAPSTIPSILGGGAAPMAYGPRPYDNSGPGRSQERLLDPPNAAVMWATPATTPVKEKKLPTLFARSPPSESDHRQPNKLKKKRAPGNLASAASSTTSLNQAASSGVVSPKLEAIHPVDRPDPSATELRDTLQAGTGVGAVRSQSDVSSEPTPRASHVRSTSSSVHLEPKAAAAANNNNSNKSPPGSIHSSFNDSFLDFDQIDDQLAHMHEHPDRRKRWRLPRPAKHEDGSQTPGVMSPRAGIGSNNYAGTSSVSVGSGTRPRRSFTADSTDLNALGIEMHQTESAGREGRDESKGPIGWIRTKYREAKESVDHKRTKSPPSEQRHGTTESLESRTTDENPSHTGPAPAANQQTVAFASRQPQHQQRPPAQQAATASVRAVYADHTAPAP